MAERELAAKHRQIENQKARAKQPEQQLDRILLSGERPRSHCCNLLQRAELFTHYGSCTTRRGVDIEPGLWLLKEEYRIGKIIRLDDKTHNRLAEIALPDEHPVDLINRLLDLAVEAKFSTNSDRQTGKTIDAGT
jgi:hypothetical protein